MTTANYPNHPLFRIAPLLDRGFNTVLHDEYTSHLVGRIRAGRYMPELWDCNGLILDYSQRLGSPADQQLFGVRSRYSMTPQEIRDYQNDPAVKAERARRSEELRALRAERKAQVAAAEMKLAARRRAEAEERAKAEREWAAAEANRKADEERRARDWERVGTETQQYLTEQAMIMAGYWECTVCQTPSEVSRQPAGRYALSCRRCGRRAIGDHATLAAIVARKNQPEPVNAG